MMILKLVSPRRISSAHVGFKKKGMQNEHQKRLNDQDYLPSYFFACAQSSYADGITSLMRSYGLEGTWSTDCAAVTDPKNIRVTYILSEKHDAPRLEAHVGGTLTSTGEVLEFIGIANNQYRMRTRSIPVAAPEKISTAWVTVQIIGNKRRAVDTVVTTHLGKELVLVHDGFRVHESADGKLTSYAVAPLSEKCVSR